MRLTSLFNLQLTVAVPRNIHRQVTIDLENESTYTWKNPSIYFQSGTTDDVLPSPVYDGKSEYCKCRGALV